MNRKAWQVWTEHRALRIATSTILGSLALAGCSDSETSGKNKKAADQAPTWHQDVAPLVMQKCGACHREGGIAPFSIETYEQAKKFAGAMAASVEAGSMPPFLAQDTDECQPRLPWKNDLRLSDAEKKLLRDWADAEAPEGDPENAAKVVEPQSVTLPREDVVMRLPEPITVDGTKDMHTCLIVDPKLESDTYVVGRLITSGNEKILHHVVSYVLQPGTNEDGSPRTKVQLEEALKAEKGVGIGGRYDCFGGVGLTTVPTEMLDAWAPGGVPNMAFPDSGQPVAKDSLVLLDLHYHPTGAGPEVDDDTRLSLMTTDEPPPMIGRTVLIGNFTGSALETEFGVGELLLQEGESKAEFMIPAGAADHVEEMTWTWKLAPGVALRVGAMSTHMHYVGRDMRVALEHTEPKEDEDDEECLIQTPAWDFNWQRGYGYDASLEELPAMHDGDVLRMRCVFDNTTANRFVVEALDDRGLEEPQDVHLGEDTLDEMCLASLSIIYPNVNP